MPRLLTMREVRERLQGVMGRPLLYAFAKRYGFRVGRKFVVPEERLEAFMRGELPLEEAKEVKEG
ncbi:MAG: hypothetical protein ACK4M2_13630 [Brevundimonas sp.]